MTSKLIDLTQRNAARVAGFAILIMTIAAVIATDVSIGSLIVPGNAPETMRNIQGSEMLFRIGVFSWLVILICDVLAAWGLFIFFKPVDKNLSLIAAWFRLIYVAILGTALLNLTNILSQLNGAEYLSVLGTEQLQAHILFYLNAFNSSWSFGLIVFGIHILILGYLIVKSDFVPKILGVLLILAFFGYVITHSSNLLFPEYKSITKIIEYIFLIPMLGEIALGIWLLYKGFKKESIQ